MSALPPKADICGAQAHVRYGPIADSCTAAKRSLFDHLGGAGMADEWWSTILQSLPSFTYVKL
jgi:hypothetical protein